MHEGVYSPLKLQDGAISSDLAIVYEGKQNNGFRYRKIQGKCAYNLSNSCIDKRAQLRLCKI
ncbi:hypothetical protein AGMMS49990_02070 [Endomicrobiia bacterium]|nr:hypothetical protein AGMMS49990_02070 [Endomicrobiia bacterium]